MASLRTLIVDDEPIARKVLREELQLIEGVEVVGEAGDGEHALAEIARLHPNVVLLDIQMPLLGGLDMLARLGPGLYPVVIMVTAYDEHAIRALERGAIDYLLKPVNQPRLEQALERAERLLQTPAKVAENVATLQAIAPRGQQDSAPPRKVVGKLGDEYFLLHPDEILAFQADGDLVWIATAQRRYLATQNLRTLEERLNSSAFRRIHRNALVNVNQIRKLSAMSSQRWLITLTNNQEFIVSKRQAGHLREVLHW